MPIDQYDFQQTSPSDMPGFMIFQNTKTEGYYFHCNDVQGKPFLYSQSYSSVESAERGLKSVLNNAVKEKRYVTHIDDAPYFFRLKAGNHQEIARSRSYEKLSDMQAAQALLQKIAGSKNPMAEEKKVVAKAKETAQKPQKNDLPRHVFRIELYEIENSEIAYAGLIKNTVSKKETSFQGLNFFEIQQFIKAELPEHSYQPKEIEGMASLRILPKNGQHHLFGKEVQNIELEMSVEEKLLQLVTQQSFLASVKVQPLFANNSLTFNKIEGIPANINAAGKIEFPISLLAFQKGTYRLSAAIKLPKKATPIGLQGSCYLQVA